MVKSLLYTAIDAIDINELDNVPNFLRFVIFEYYTQTIEKTRIKNCHFCRGASFVRWTLLVSRSRSSKSIFTQMLQFGCSGCQKLSSASTLAENYVSKEKVDKRGIFVPDDCLRIPR